MLVFPNAKINLGLNILSKREDGYHNIESCLYPIPWCDALEAVPSKEFSFSQTGLNVEGNPQDNLCVKAYQLLAEHHGIPPVQLHLHKVIPMGAGLGGGSSDGAFTLKLLNTLFELDLPSTLLEEYAASLGSDCPFFIANKPGLATGTGTQISPIDLDLSDWYIGIIYPNVHISTAEAYAGVTPKPTKTSLKHLLKNEVSSWQKTLKNDFEVEIRKNHTEIDASLTKLQKDGAVYYALSGSGSAVFGLFEDEPNGGYHFVAPLAEN